MFVHFTGQRYKKNRTYANVRLFFFMFLAFYNAAITSISTKPPLGNAATATALRAGNGAAKRVEYTSLRTAKLAMSVRKTVVLIT